MDHEADAPAPRPGLSADERIRYSRHLLLPGFGEEGQRRLKAASVLVVGAGGLGSPLAMYLAAAGVGRIGLVDFDRVDASNLQRQVLYGTADLGRPKLDAARARLLDLNPGIEVATHAARLDSGNALQLVPAYDVVVDGTDNFPTRYLVNDACALAGRPNVHGSIFRFEGQATVFDAARGPCYRCLYPDPPPPGLVPSCAEGGVLGVLPGVIGVVQAIETIKLLLGQGEPLIGRLLLFDALGMRFRELTLRKDPACPLCGERRTVTGLIDYESFCGVSPGGGALEVSAAEVAASLRAPRPPLLLDVREPAEHAIASLPGARLIPLRALPGRLGELDPSRPLVVYCHRGQRSLAAVDLLRAKGFQDARSLRGGIDAWSREVDPAVPLY